MRAVCLLLALLPGLAGAVVLPITDARPLAAEGELRLRMPAGALELRPGTEPEVRLEGELAPGTRLRWRETANGLGLVLEHRERLSPPPARLRLAVPATARLRLEVGDTAVDAQGVGEGGLRLRGGGGDVAVRGGEGLRELHVETGAGAIRLDLPRPGRVRAESVGGAIEARLGGTEGAEVRLESFSGPLRLQLPAGGPARLELRQAGGPLVLPEAAQARPDGTVVLGEGEGEGGGRVRLVTFSGAVRVLEDPTLQRTNP